MNALEKETKPVWLDEMDKLVKDTQQKVDAIQEKLNEVYFGKGARPELTPPGAPPTFAKSFWGKVQVETYKDDIEEAKKSAYNHCSKMLEYVDVNERMKFAGEIKKNLEVTRPDSMQPKNKEEQKDLDASQNFMKGETGKFVSNDNTKPILSEQRENKTDIFRSRDIDKE